jgi:hypothetical protein
MMPNITMQTVSVKAATRKLKGTWTVIDENEIWVREAYHGEWAIEVPWRQWKEVIAWCAEAYGECGHNRKYRWRQNYRPEMNRIFLRNESDVTLFKLKWL